MSDRDRDRDRDRDHDRDRRRRHEVDIFIIRQILMKGFHMNSITGIVVGSKGSFTSLNVPAGSIVPPGKTPVWASDNPLAVVTAASDGLSATVAVDSAAVAGESFNLSISVIRSDGATASGTASVPFLPVPPVEVSSFEITQVA